MTEDLRCRQCRRVTRPGGGVSIDTPDGDTRRYCHECWCGMSAARDRRTPSSELLGGGSLDDHL